MEYCIEFLEEATLFSVLECNSGFWQVLVPEEDKNQKGTYRYRRMSFGLQSAAAKLQRALDMFL